MKLLYEYLNGNVIVFLYSDGTKIQEWPDGEVPNPEFPNSIDIKITNRCDLMCPFCHEMSVPDGAHADLEYVLSTLSTLPSGTELAIGGGNPLSHPGLKDFLETCVFRYKFVPNLTVNAYHIKQNLELINYLIDNQLIYGLGISITDQFDLNILNEIHDKSNVVLHVIAGVNRLSILSKAKQFGFKVLILGYKSVGRGIEFESEETLELKKEWYDGLNAYISKVPLSFDNLAVTQLQVQRFVSPEYWKQAYMGDDGQFTMYIDGVKQEFAVSSTSVDKFPLIGTMREIFKKVRQESKK